MLKLNLFSLETTRIQPCGYALQYSLQPIASLIADSPEWDRHSNTRVWFAGFKTSTIFTSIDHYFDLKKYAGSLWKRQEGYIGHPKTAHFHRRSAPTRASPTQHESFAQCHANAPNSAAHSANMLSLETTPQTTSSAKTSLLSLLGDSANDSTSAIHRCIRYSRASLTKAVNSGGGAKVIESPYRSVQSRYTGTIASTYALNLNSNPTRSNTKRFCWMSSYRPSSSVRTGAQYSVL